MSFVLNIFVAVSICVLLMPSTNCLQRCASTIFCGVFVSVHYLSRLQELV